MARKRKRCGVGVCAYDTAELYGHFAGIALAELKSDPAWKAHVYGLAELFAGESDVPL